MYFLSMQLLIFYYIDICFSESSVHTMNEGDIKLEITEHQKYWDEAKALTKTSVFVFTLILLSNMWKS